VLARVQGAVLGVETDAGGVDEAHVRKADGAARADRTSTRS
jgi:hypothetical protein